MYFKRIEMHGFKSFAEPVVIEFHEGVTCIVGPNGSGKSNISDALRWVLGEQSPKALRGGKMEEVIFSGTASRKSRGMAEVTLVVDNSTGILPIDYNEVAITRRMYRSGESEYLINNNQCRLRDIRELIMDTGIGVDGYSLIGQGKIADIVSNKPESRREIFEEAAGVVLYKSKKQEAERKLTSTSLNLDRANDIIGEIEGRIDGLREDSMKATEALALRERRRDLEINITLRNVEKFSASNEAGTSDIEQLSAGIEELDKEKLVLEKKVQESRERNQTLDNLGSEARDKLVLKVEEIGNITNRTQLDGEKMAALERDEARLKTEIEALNLKLTKELENAEAYEEAKAQIEEKQQAGRKVLEESISRYNEITAESFKADEAVENAKNTIMKLQVKASEKYSEVRSYEGYKESLEKRRAQILAEDAQLEQDRIEAGKTLRRYEDESKEKEAMKNAALLKLSNTKEKQNQTAALVRELLKKGEDLRIRGGQLTARRKTIEEMEANYEGYNGAVKYIMRREIAGVEGVVAELMNAPKGYEVAVETALGAGLQNIVCLRDEDAKKCINVLKENKAGRLTFLPMESVKGTTAAVNQAVKSARGFEGMASELIDFDEKYRGVFNYLLGRVAIVDNMDTAVKLSKIADKGIRFVTLEGEIINSGGAITGGKYKNATANLLSRRNEIEKLTTDLRTIKSEFEKNQQELISKEEEGVNLAAEAAGLEEEVRNLERSYAEISAMVKNLQSDSQGEEERREKRTRELSSLEQDYKNAEDLALKAEGEAKEAEGEMKELEASIEDFLKEREALKEKIAEAGEAITQARVGKTELDGALEAQEQLLSRVLDLIDDYTEQIEAKEDALEALDQSKSHLVFGSDGVEEQVERLNREKEELEEYIAGVTKEKNDLQAELHEMEGALNKLSGQIDSFRDQKQQQEIRMAKNEANLETAKQKLWDDFEISYAQALEYRKEDFVYSTAVKESREIKNRLDELGDINIGSIKEYEEVKERYTFLTEQRRDILSAMDELKSIIKDMDRIIKTRFKENFDKVVINFEEIFQELFGGGYAELRLDDEDNPLEAGIEIVAQPPGKKLQNINLMSGGEKTMTAIALMFAVLKTKPTPFCILDEVEAALDDANIDRFANYLKKFNEIQFTIVTHQKVTMEHADVLYGVTMPEQGISKVLSLRLGDNFEV